MSQPNELKNLPEWIGGLSKEQQYMWYLNIKNSLPLWKTLRDTTELEKAIKDYESRNNLV